MPTMLKLSRVKPIPIQYVVKILSPLTKTIFSRNIKILKLKNIMEVPQTISITN
jgi:hypothetical protein